MSTLYKIYQHALKQITLPKVRAFLLPAALIGHLLLQFPANAMADDIHLLAAASLTEAITEAIESYKSISSDRVIGLFASSSSLAKQILNSSPADIFISANLTWMDTLIRENLIETGTRKDILGNRLVLIAPISNTMDLSISKNLDITFALGDSRLAIGDPNFVPAGQYAASALKQLGIWHQVVDRLAPGSDVRNTLTLVQRGEAVLGIVYETDVPVGKNIRIVDYFPIDSYPPVIYSFGIVRGKNSPAVQSFYDYLTGVKAMEIFITFGFIPR